MNNNIELRINNIVADIDSSSELSLSKTFDLSSVEEYSYEFTLPATKTNQKIFRYLNKLHTDNKFFYNYYAELICRGVLVFQGSLLVSEATNEYYSCNLTGSAQADVDDIFGDMLINTPKVNQFSCILPNPEYELAYKNDPSAANMVNNLYGKALWPGWIYPMALYGKPYNVSLRGLGYTGVYNKSEYDDEIGWSYNAYPLDNNVTGQPNDVSNIPMVNVRCPEQYLMPMMNITSIVKSLFLDRGYVSFTGSFFNDDSIFSRMYQSFQGDYDDFLERNNQRFVLQTGTKIPTTGCWKDGNTISYKPFIYQPYSNMSEEWEFEEDADNRPLEPEASITIMNPATARNASYKRSLGIRFAERNLWSDDIVDHPIDNAYRKVSVDNIFLGTPTNMDKEVMWNKDEDNKSYYVKIIKSGWYTVNLKGQFKLVNSARGIRRQTGSATNWTSHNGRIYDSVNFRRNAMEIQLTKRNTKPNFYSCVTGYNTNAFKNKDFRNVPRLFAGYTASNSPRIYPYEYGYIYYHQLGNVTSSTVRYISPHYIINTNRDGMVMSDWVQLDSDKNTFNSSGDVTQRFSNNWRSLLGVTMPTNKGTLYVNNDEFICGVRIGHQYYSTLENPILTDAATGDKRSAYVAINGTAIADDKWMPSAYNRDPYSHNMNLPKLNITNSSAIGYANSATDYGYDRFMSFRDSVYEVNGARIQTYQTNSRIDQYKGPSDRTYYSDYFCGCHDDNQVNNSDLIGLNLLNPNRGYAPRSDNFVVKQGTPQIDTRVTGERLNTNGLADGAFADLDNANFKIEYNESFIDDGVSTADFDTTNVVYFEAGDELELKSVTPVIRNDYNGKWIFAPVNVGIDCSATFKYIGTSDNEWKPTPSDLTTQPKRTYLNQFLPEESAADWLNGLRNLFNISIKANYITKNVQIDYSDNSRFDQIIDITQFCDFGSMISDGGFSFEQNTKPSYVSVEMKSDPDNFGVGKSKVEALELGGNDDPNEIQTSYESSFMMPIKMMKKDWTVDRIINMPVLSSKKVWEDDYEGFSNYLTRRRRDYTFSGSKNPRLYFFNGSDYLTGWNNQMSSVRWVGETLNFNRKYPLMSTTLPDTPIDLANPLTIIDTLYSYEATKDYLIVQCFLPLHIFNRITKDTLLKLDGSLFKVYKIDNYDVTGGVSCELTLIPQK